MTRCLAECRCTLTLKVFLSVIFLYLMISCSLMIPSIREYSDYKAQIQALDHSKSEVYECYQICNNVYRYFKQPSLCCSNSHLDQCFTKDECKVVQLINLKKQQESALFDIRMGIGITVFSLLVLTIIFRKKYSHFVRQEEERRQNLMNFYENGQQGNINASLLKQSTRISVYKSFIEEDHSQQTICVICYQMFQNEKVIKLDCRHKFHGDCIRQWLTKKSDCPVCRANA